MSGLVSFFRDDTFPESKGCRVVSDGQLDGLGFVCLLIDQPHLPTHVVEVRWHRDPTRLVELQYDDDGQELLVDFYTVRDSQATLEQVVVSAVAKVQAGL